MKITTVDMLLDSFGQLLDGGGGDTPDHCYWAGTKILDALDHEGVSLTEGQRKLFNQLRYRCSNESGDYPADLD